MLLQSCYHAVPKQEKIVLPSYVTIPKGVIIDKKILFENVKIKYDTLIPIFDGLFITYDTVSLEENSNTIDTILKYKWYHAPSKEAKKWGVIDSIGHPLIPFTCDAIRVISKDIGIATMLKSTYPLDTGVPRYQYKGIYFFFTINGKEKSKEHPFEMALFGLHYNENDVITMGNEYFLPLEYRRKNP
jgi:hypothetical protein